MFESITSSGFGYFLLFDGFNLKTSKLLKSHPQKTYTTGVGFFASETTSSSVSAFLLVVFFFGLKH
jgi:hypothetical protein